MSKSFITFNFSNAAANVCLVFSFRVLKDEMFLPCIFSLVVKLAVSPFNFYNIFSPRTILNVKSLESNDVMMNYVFAYDIFKSNAYFYDKCYILNGKMIPANNNYN